MALASAVLTRVRDTLLDPSGNRWTDAELLRYLSDGQSEVCAYYPEANTLTELYAPTVGVVRVDWRDEAAAAPVAILRFASAHDEKNNIEGYELKLVEKAVLDAFDPGWIGYRPATAAANVPATSAQYYKAVVMDPKDPLAFWLYPRAHQDFSIYVTYTAIPTELVAAGTTLALSDQYVPMLTDYVVYRALAKDSLYTGAPTKAKEHQDAFMQKLALSTGRRTQLAPPNARAPDEH